MQSMSVHYVYPDMIDEDKCLSILLDFRGFEGLGYS
jgi:hypothetical protein